MNTVTRMIVLSGIVVTAGLAGAAGNPGVEPITQGFLEALESGGGTPLEQVPPDEARQVLVGAQAGVKLELPPAKVEQRSIPVDGVEVPLIIVRPERARGILPVFMFFHGGGWVLGDYPTHERLVRDLVVESGAVAVFVDYSRSPEVKYPVALNQAYAATQWVAEHGKEIGVDGSRLAVVGNSAGGNLAAAVTLMAAEKGSPAIRFQVLLWPVTDANLDTDSYHAYAGGHFLTRDMMRWFWDSYIPDPPERGAATASPLQADAALLRKLPPALIQVAQYDVLRDEGVAYGQKLQQAGVPVTVTEYHGMIHDFGLLNALAEVPGTRSAMLQAGAELRRHLK